MICYVGVAMSATNGFSLDKTFVSFVMLFCSVSLIPWLAFYFHGQSEEGSGDGPVAIFLLSATATAILLILLIYSLAVYLVRFIQVIHFIKWVIVVLLAIVVLFCFSCTAVWASFLERSSILFLCAALGYVALAVHLMWQIASVIKVKQTLPMK